MVNILAADYSFARPDPKTLAAAGVKAVGRYLGGSTGKQITKLEAAALHDAGIGIWLVFESTAGRAINGSQADGETDAQAARAQAATVGYNTNCPIFFAVDSAASAAQVQNYFAGVRRILGDRTGIYGGNVVFPCATWLWQAGATSWSTKYPGPAAHIVQGLAGPVAGTDVDHIQHPVPVWTKNGYTTLGKSQAAAQAGDAKPKTKAKAKAKNKSTNVANTLADAELGYKQNKAGARKNLFGKIVNLLKGKK